MENAELSKELMVISLRNNVEISLEKDRADKIVPLMESRKFIEIDGRIINTSDIVGIFPAVDMESAIRRKNGQWLDKWGVWHDKGTRTCPRCGQELQADQICGRCR
jgi:hypothetical protein